MAKASPKTWEEYKAECEVVAKPGITILGWVGEWRGSRTKLLCHCAVHGDWNTTVIYHFKNGKSCPQCAKVVFRQSTGKSWLEYLPTIQSIAEAKGYLVKGHGEWKGNMTKLHLVCPVHGEWSSTTIGSFISGRGCSSCGRVTTTQSSILPNEVHIAQFLASGKFKEGTTFVRRVCGLWEYTCPVCSNDEYVHAGVCDGVFTSRTHGLKNGKLTCRCSKTYRYTKTQWEYRLGKECASRGYAFKSWKDNRYKSNAVFIYVCPKHGEQSVFANHFLCGNGCPECAGQNQQQCYINVVKDEELPVALKIGIAKDSDIRLRQQNSKNLFQMSRIALYEFPTVEDCKSAERMCLSELRCSILSSRELKDGWTETVALTDYDKVVSIYERFGGVRVDTNINEGGNNV